MITQSDIEKYEQLEREVSELQYAAQCQAGFLSSVCCATADKATSVLRRQARLADTGKAAPPAKLQYVRARSVALRSVLHMQLCKSADELAALAKRVRDKAHEIEIGELLDSCP